MNCSRWPPGISQASILDRWSFETVDGFFNGLLDCLRHAVQERFLPAKHASVAEEGGPTLVELYDHENAKSTGYIYSN